MEILAPAGSPAAFISAIDAGADAVYAAPGNFNARRRAQSFSLKEFRQLVAYAHSKKRKVYAVVNTLIKEAELPTLHKELENAISSGADALILQDLAVVNIANRISPKIPIHASTQMTIHNSAGVLAMQKMGFSRAILARELSAEEILSIASKSNLELEIFVYGALCFSISGICFASSFIGGRSGNRGECTQPCRRKWSCGKSDKFFFSTCDLDYREFYEKIKNSVTSLKIEGRMKNATYVYRAVKYWRAIVDGAPISEEFSENFTRKSSAYYISGGNGTLLNSSEPPSVGRYLGKLQKTEDGSSYFQTQSEIKSGDRLRICGADGEELESLKLTSNFELGTKISLDNFKYRKNCSIYLADRELQEYSAESRLKSVMSKSLPFQIRSVRVQMPPKLKKIGKNLNPALFIKLQSASNDAFKLPAQYWILPFTSQNMAYMREHPQLRKKLFWELPCFIPEARLQTLRSYIRESVESGFKNWILQNFSHFELLPKATFKIAGSLLYSMNSEAMSLLSKQGTVAFISSYEDDFLNLRNAAGFNRIFQLYNNPPIFFSRAQAVHYFDSEYRFKQGDLEVAISKHEDYLEFYSIKPYSIFQHIKKLRALNPYGFLIDLSHTPQQEYCEVLNLYRDEAPCPNSCKYNFKRELK